MTRRFALLSATALLLAGLSACGQKGPLYLPEDRPEQPQPQPQPEKREPASGPDAG